MACTLAGRTTRRSSVSNMAPRLSTSAAVRAVADLAIAFSVQRRHSGVELVYLSVVESAGVHPILRHGGVPLRTLSPPVLLLRSRLSSNRRFFSSKSASSSSSSSTCTSLAANSLFSKSQLVHRFIEGRIIITAVNDHHFPFHNSTSLFGLDLALADSQISLLSGSSIIPQSGQ